MKTYQQWAEYLGNKIERPCGNNTRVHRVTAEFTDGGGQTHLNKGVAVRLHATDVVTLWENGAAVLNSGGFRTNTTKARLNEFGPVQIWQQKGVWRFQRGGVTYVFADGVTIHPDGTVSGAGTEAELAVEKSLRKEISKYAKLCADAVPMNPPGPGDCLYCNANREEGNFGGTEHLLAHMRESYVVPSLVYRALKDAGNSALVIQGAFKNDQTNGSEWITGLARERVQQHVAKFMRRQFGMA